jgi:hypothetical protein
VLRLALIAVLVAFAPVDAQSSPRRSQRAELLQLVGETEIRAMYIRPVARGRELFGKLVPYGRVWTPSADSAMRLTFSTDVQVEGQQLKAGSYSVWVIPDSSAWTIVFNKNPTVFHLSHRPSDDLLKVPAKTDSLSHVETLTLSFPVVDGRKAVMQIQWGTVAAQVELEVP